MTHHTTRRATRRTLMAALAIAATVGLAACGGGDEDGDELAGARTAAPTAQPVKVAQPVQPAAQPTTAAPTSDALPDGTHEVHAVRAEDGALVLDRGRFVQGEPTEPGVDSTAPITFDTGSAAERRTTPIAEDASLRLHVAGDGLREVTRAELVAAVEGDRPLHATVRVADGQVVDLEELYRA